ncbi:hypothetical protein GN956_G19974 [Arapaima gigas]
MRAAGRGRFPQCGRLLLSSLRTSCGSGGRRWHNCSLLPPPKSAHHTLVHQAEGKRATCGRKGVQRQEKGDGCRGSGPQAPPCLSLGDSWLPVGPGDRAKAGFGLASSQQQPRTRTSPEEGCAGAPARAELSRRGAHARGVSAGPLALALPEPTAQQISAAPY